MVTVQAVAYKDESFGIHNRKMSATRLLSADTFSALNAEIVTSGWTSDLVLKSVPASFKSPPDAVIDQPRRAS